jgi:hypothetical protein
MKVSLRALAELITCNTKQEASVQGCWQDYGAGIWHDTIIVDSAMGGYQALSPRDVREIKDGIFTIEDAQRIIDEINKRGW